MERELFIAIDIGGTKTLAVLFNKDGEVLSVRRSAGITPVDAPFDECLERYKEIAKEISADAKEYGRIKSLYASVATAEIFHTQMYEAFRAGTDAEIVRVEPDGMCLISGMLGHVDAAALICGTGSSLFVRSCGETYENDSNYRIGGWGHLIDSCGSGFVLGRLAIQAVFRDYDGRDGHTLITKLVEEKLGHKMSEEYLNIYSQGRPFVASFAPYVFEARKQGDEKASRIFDACTSDLAELVWTAQKREGHPMTVVFNGGVFEHFPEYAEAVKSKCPAGTTVIFGDAKPIYGCAVEALYAAGYTCDEDFKKQFNKGLE